MSATFTGQQMALGLLSGSIDGTQLETYLAEPLYLGAWKQLVKTAVITALLNSAVASAAIFESNTAFTMLLEQSGEELAASDNATAAIFAVPASAKLIVTDYTYLDLWNTVPANKTRLQALINASGSVLYRSILTSGVTWTRPSGGFTAMSLGNIGKGGVGGTAQSGVGSGQGGSGANIKTQQWTTGLPSGNITISLSTDAVFTGYLTALAGVGGTASNGTNTGPGSDTGTIYDTDMLNAIWQPYTASKKGGNGGAGASTPSGAGSAGTAGLSGSGGTAGAGTGSFNTSTPGGPGSGLGSGGGGGGVSPGSGAQATSPATDPGCGGPGGCLRGTDVTNGDAAGPARIIVHGILTAALP